MYVYNAVFSPRPKINVWLELGMENFDTSDVFLWINFWRNLNYFDDGEQGRQREGATGPDIWGRALISIIFGSIIICFLVLLKIEMQCGELFFG